ncbi:MAG: hypothetical protein NTY48_04195 [Candidatus Diapherotrites archaeon]|nr:hypothetical protein [Candidatus Diapherotrites archaeon]
MSKSFKKKNTGKMIPETEKGGKGVFGKSLFFVSNYKGFSLAVIVVLFAILLLLLNYAGVSNGVPDFTAEKISYAQGLYTSNQELLDSYVIGMETQAVPDGIQAVPDGIQAVPDGIQAVPDGIQAVPDGTQVAEGETSTINDDYYTSTKQDIDWLKNKETQLYKTPPIRLLFARELAYSGVMQLVMTINTSTVFQLSEQDYTSSINEAKNQGITMPMILSQQEIDDTFSSSEEKDAFNKTCEELFKEYVALKKQILESNASKERKFVEAKKLLWITDS